MARTDGDSKHTAKRLTCLPERGYLNGRRVIVVDGTGVSIPDTHENQTEWPQFRNQFADTFSVSIP
ncbi:MAG: hypothetical protein K9M54_08510 [Kiritimatiellales bacterium]|nr:hypothetical protein [Kiritimatiellales bacterium]